MRNRLAGALVLCAILDASRELEPTAAMTIPQQDARHPFTKRRSIDVTPDGRYVAFTSYARLVNADTNDGRDIYMLDRATGAVTLESMRAGLMAPMDSDHPDLSDDGRFLVYEAHLITETAEPLNVVLRDRQKDDAWILSVGFAGARADGPSRSPSISGDGQVVAFSSAATNLSADADINGSATDIYIAVVASRTIERIGSSRSIDHGSSVSPVVDATGRFIAFASAVEFDPARVAAGGRQAHLDVYVYDRSIRTTKRVSAGRQGRRTNAASWAPAISADGRYIAFVSAASNLVADDGNQAPDVFVVDWRRESIELISRSRIGDPGNDGSDGPSISSDGRYVAFHSEASNLVDGSRGAYGMQDVNLLPDVFLFDRHTRSMTHVSRDAAGFWMEPSVEPSLDAAGRVLAFSSRHPINVGDRRNDFDLFLVASSPPQRPGSIPAGISVLDDGGTRNRHFKQ